MQKITKYNNTILLFEQLNIKIYRNIENEIICYCPFPEHDDLNPSFSYNKLKNLYNCFVCGGGTLQQLAKRLGFEIDLPLENIQQESLFDIKEDKYKETEDVILPEIKFPFMFTGEIPEFIKERGFIDSNLTSRWDMCYNISTGSLILPIRDSKKRIVGWVCRRPNGIEPRYLYAPVGFEKSKVLFGEYLLRENQNFVCVCEGPLDAIWLDQHGYNAVAILGMQLSETQQRRLINLRKGEYVICLDNDDAGRKGIYGYRDKKNKQYHPGFISKMKKYGILSIIELPENKKDVQDIRDSKQLIDIIENRKLVY